MCNYYNTSSAVWYHYVWSLVYSVLFGWCHTGTNIQCYNQATGGGYSEWWFSVLLPLIIGMQFRKNESVYYSSVSAGVIISLETRFAYINEEPHYLTATVLNPRYKLRLTDNSVQKYNADHWADGRSWHFPARWLVLIAQFQSTDVASDDLHAGCRAQWHQRG